MAAPSLSYIIAGQLRRDYVLFPNGKSLLDVPGGNLIYSAAGMAVWQPEVMPGLVARVGEDYPRDWLDRFAKAGFDTRGIRILPEAIDLRSFYVYADLTRRLSEDPVTHFARLGQPLPRSLLNYRAKPNNLFDSRTKLSQISLRQADLPTEFLEASAAHLCPVDFLTHTLLPAILRQAGFTTVTLDPSTGTMTPTFWDDIPALLTGLTAFLPSEGELRNLFHGRSVDLWEKAEALGAYGCEFVVIKRGESGQHLYDSASHTRWEISAYPARLADLTGAGDAFCGGFLLGYCRTYDPVQAALHGAISASLVIEGSGPFYAMEALPGLAQARLEALRETAHKV
jgi:sugar/nucleoside kinase (ribokinase family)